MTILLGAIDAELDQPYIPYYYLSYVDECGTEHEHEFKASNDAMAVEHALSHVKGSEGLWSGILLIREDDVEIAEPVTGWR